MYVRMWEGTELFQMSTSQKYRKLTIGPSKLIRLKGTDPPRRCLSATIDAGCGFVHRKDVSNGHLIRSLIFLVGAVHDALESIIRQALPGLAIAHTIWRCGGVANQESRLSRSEKSGPDDTEDEHRKGNANDK